jgi:hypothetical protein
MLSSAASGAAGGAAVQAAKTVISKMGRIEGTLTVSLHAV